MRRNRPTPKICPTHGRGTIRDKNENAKKKKTISKGFTGNSSNVHVERNGKARVSEKKKTTWVERGVFIRRF